VSLRLRLAKKLLRRRYLKIVWTVARRLGPRRSVRLLRWFFPRLPLY